MNVRSAWLDTKNIALLGFMTAGKSRVGQALALRTGLPLRDVDLLIEAIEGIPIHRIFQEKGEPYFRALESRVLADLCAGSGQIVSLGGGTVLLAENRALLRARCVAVWLGVSVEQVLTRLADPESPRRPLLEGRDPAVLVPQLLGQREAFYAEALGDDGIRVETDGRGIDDLAAEIALRLGLVG